MLLMADFVLDLSFSIYIPVTTTDGLGSISVPADLFHCISYTFKAKKFK